MTTDDKRLYCSILAQLLIIDGAVTDDERAFLDAVFLRLGLGVADRQAVYNSVNVDDSIEEKVRRLSPDDGPRALYEATVDAVRMHVAPYADVTSGIVFRLHQPEAVLPRWQRQLAALRSAALR